MNRGGKDTFPLLPISSMTMHSPLLIGLTSALLFAATPAFAVSVYCPERICHYYDRNGVCTNYTCVNSHTDPYVGTAPLVAPYATYNNRRYRYDDGYTSYRDRNYWNSNLYDNTAFPSYESGVYSRTPNTSCGVNSARCQADIRYQYRRTYDGRYDDYTCRQSYGRCAGLNCVDCTYRPYERGIDSYYLSRPYDSYYYGTQQDRCYYRTGGTCVR